MRSTIVTALLLPILLARTAVAAPTNVTVDDFDRTRITYTPLSAWQSTSDGSTEDRYMKTTTFTRTQGAFASFTFGGATAIYFGGFGEIDDVPGTFDVQIDGTTKTVSGNIDRAHLAQQILFSKTNLDPKKNYTITVSKSSVSGSHDLNVDFFTYTIDPDSGDVNQNIQNAPVAAIAGGIVAGVVVLALIAVIIFLAIRRRRRRAAAGGGKTGKNANGEPKVDLDGGRVHAPIVGGGSLMSPNGPRYSDYMNPSAGAPPAGAEYHDPYGTLGGRRQGSLDIQRQGSFDQTRSNLAAATFAASSGSAPQSHPQYPLSHSDQPYYPTTHSPPLSTGQTPQAQPLPRKGLGGGHGPTQSHGALYNPTISGAANLNRPAAPTTGGGSSVAYTLSSGMSLADSASRSGGGAPSEISEGTPLSPAPPAYDRDSAGAQARQQQTSLFPPRKS